MLNPSRFPHVFVLLTAVIFVCSLLTYVVPSGEYKREKRQVGIGERTVVVPGTYAGIEKDFSSGGILFGGGSSDKAQPVSFFGFLSAIPRGMQQAADIIFFIFIIGGVFGILQRTGTIIAAIQKLLQLFAGSSQLMVIILMIAVGIGASTLGMGEEFIPLVPLFLIVSKKLGYDRLFGLGIVLVAAQVGFAAATTNPFTVQIAQSIAEVPLNSGLLFRLIFFVVAMSVGIVYVLRYGAMIKKNPQRSLMADDDFTLDGVAFDSVTFTARHGAIIGIGVLLFAFIICAVQELGWWMSEMAGGFFLIGIAAVAISRLPLNEGAKAFVKGMEEMVVAALVVGFAKGVQVVLDDGKILDTIIHAAATALEQYHEFVAAAGMLVFQTALNVLIPSGSGQAAVTMPLMAPLADLLGITRQTAVFAFTCGDGFSNMVIPTSGLLMAMLGMAKIPFVRWVRFSFPLFGMLFGLSMLFLVLAVLTGY